MVVFLRFLEQLEHRAEPLLPKSRFYRRAVWSALIGGTMYAVTLAGAWSGSPSWSGSRPSTPPSTPVC